jgi:uncharacterized protein (TIGR04255 family)
MNHTVSFRNPPVVERVLGVQFEPLGLTSGHLGWFWKTYLTDEWTKANDAPPLNESYERFGKFDVDLPKIRFEARSEIPANRLQIRKADGRKILQIQDTRFVLNWVRTDEGDYPRYPAIRAEFFGWFERFVEFSSAAGLQAIEVNQWEVAYVNHIDQGGLWSTPADWPNVIPGLLFRVQDFGGTHFERMSGEWHCEIPEQRGRLYSAVQYQQRPSGAILRLNFTARGPVRERAMLQEKFDLGHEAIIRSFVDITSPAAHEVWGKES